MNYLAAEDVLKEQRRHSKYHEFRTINIKEKRFGVFEER